MARTSLKCYYIVIIKWKTLEFLKASDIKEMITDRNHHYANNYRYISKMNLYNKLDNFRDR